MSKPVAIKRFLKAVWLLAEAMDIEMHGIVLDTKHEIAYRHYMEQLPATAKDKQVLEFFREVKFRSL